MKRFGGIIMVAAVAALIGAPFILHERQIDHQEKAAAHEEVERYHLRKVVEIDRLQVENSQLDEQIATQHGKTPDRQATLAAQKALATDEAVLADSESGVVAAR